MFALKVINIRWEEMVTTQNSGRARLVLGHEGVGDALHAVHGADEGDRGAPADH